MSHFVYVFLCFFLGLPFLSQCVAARTNVEKSVVIYFDEEVDKKNNSEVVIPVQISQSIQEKPNQTFEEALLTQDFAFVDSPAMMMMPMPSLVGISGFEIVLPTWVSPIVRGYRITIDRGWGYVKCFKANVTKLNFRLTKKGQTRPIIDIHLGRGRKNGSNLIGICNTGTSLRFQTKIITYYYDSVQKFVYEICRDIGIAVAAAWVIAKTIGPPLWTFIQRLPVYAIPL